MSQKWACDKCGTETYLSPPFEQVMEEVKVKVPHATLAGVTTTKTELRPKMIKAKRMNHITGLIEEYAAPAIRDLKPRAYPVRLQVDVHTYIQRDFCKKCRDELETEISKLWNLLASFDPK